jgi:hypothetical protein
MTSKTTSETTPEMTSETSKQPSLTDPIDIQPCILPFTGLKAHMYHVEQLYNLTHLEITVAAGAKRRHILSL